MDAHLWCTCPRCYGRRWPEVSEYLAEHQGVDVRPHEVSVELPEDGGVDSLVFTGETDDDGYPLQVLVQVYPNEGTAEVSYRRRSLETWSAPTVVYEGDAEVRAIRSSQRRHPSAQ